MANDQVVSLCSRARKALAQAKTLEDFKSVRDCGEAAIRLAKSRRDIGVEALFEAQEIVRRAERQMGSMLGTMAKNKGGRPTETCNTVLQVSVPSLDELGIERIQASRFQRIAQVPDEQFEEWICDCRAVGDELTQAAARRRAAECTADPIVRPAKEAHELIADALDAAVCKFIGRLTEKHQFAFVRMRLDRILATVKRMEADHGG